MLKSLHIKFFFRPLASLLSIICLPFILGNEEYSFFLENYYYYLAILSILTSSSDNVLIVSSSKKFYAEMILLSGILLFIVFILLLLTQFAFSSFYDYLPYILCSFCYMLNNLLRRYKIDNFYYYNDIIIILFVIFIFSTFNIPSSYYPFLLSFLFLFSIIFFRFSIFNSIKRLNRNKVIYYYLIFKKMFLINFFASLVKNIDNFYIKFFSFTPSEVIIYRLIKNSFGFTKYINNLQLEDFWVSGSNKSYNFFSIYFIYFLAVPIIPFINLYSYFLNTSISFFENTILILITIFIIYLIKESKYQILSLQTKMFNSLINSYFVSLFIFIIIAPLSFYSIYLLLFALYFSHLVNIILIKRKFVENIR